MQATQRSGEDAHLKLEVQEMTASTAAAEHAAQVDATLDAEARYSTECAKVEQLAQQMAMMQSKLATTEAVFLPSPAAPAHSRFAAHARSPQPRPIAIFEPPTRPPTDPTVPTHPTHGDTETRTLARGRAVTPEACLACGAPHRTAEPTWAYLGARLDTSYHAQEQPCSNPQAGAAGRRVLGSALALVALVVHVRHGRS
jgi:hypothetical protein